MGSQSSRRRYCRARSLIYIRNPKWTSENPYQDIPIMMFYSSPMGFFNRESPC